YVLSNLSDEEYCARITTVIKKKDIAQNSTMHAAALTGYLSMMMTLNS
ncbi:hypothetical protein CEXT_419091, partial [Caerostris extrusa]